MACGWQCMGSQAWEHFVPGKVWRSFDATIKSTWKVGVDGAHAYMFCIPLVVVPLAWLVRV